MMTEPTLQLSPQSVRQQECYHIIITCCRDDTHGPSFQQVLMEDGKTVIECSRDIGLIYYLTKGWTKEQGGLFQVGCLL